MKLWTRLTVEHPKIILCTAAFITLLACIGMQRLRFDPSSGALVAGMPGRPGCPSAAAGEFGDARNAFSISVEPSGTIELFSRAVFSSMGQLVSEIEEFREFHREAEDSRIDLLCSAGHIAVAASKAGSGAGPVKEKKLADTDGAARPARERRAYSYRYYRPVTISRICDGMDEGALRQMKSVLKYAGLDSLRYDHLLSRDEFRMILETWETLYILKSREMIESLTDPLSGLSIEREGRSFSARALAPMEDGRRQLPSGKDSFAAYKKRLFSNPSFRSLLYAKRKDTVAALGIHGEIRQAEGAGEMFAYLGAVIDRYDRPPLVVNRAGPPAKRQMIGAIVLDDLRITVPLAVLAVVTVVCVAARTVLPALPVGLAVGQAMLWTAGLMGYCEIPLNAAGIMVFPLVMLLAGSWSGRYAAAFARERAMKTRAGCKYGLVVAFDKVFRAVFFSALAVIAASAALSVNPVRPVGGFGLAALLGAFSSFAASAAFIPAAFAFLAARPGATLNAKRFRDRGVLEAAGEAAIKLLEKAVAARPGCLVVAYLIAAGLCIFGIVKADFTTSPFYFCGVKSEMTSSEGRVAAFFGGPSPVNIVLDSGASGGAAAPEFLQAADDIAKWISAEPGQGGIPGHACSFVDLIKGMNMAANRNDSDSYAIPDDESTVKRYISEYSGRDRDADSVPDLFEGLVDRDFRRVNIRARVPASRESQFLSRGHKNGDDELSDYIRKNQHARGYEWCRSGEYADYADLSAGAEWFWARGALFAALGAAAVVMLVLKSWRAGAAVLGLLPAVAIMVFGTAGLAGTALSHPVCTAVGATIAVGVECAIAYLSALGSGTSGGLGLRDAAIVALGDALRTVFPVMLSLVAGSFILTFSAYVPFAAAGWLLCLACLASAWTFFVMLPSVCVLVGEFNQK